MELPKTCKFLQVSYKPASFPEKLVVSQVYKFSKMKKTWYFFENLYFWVSWNLIIALSQRKINFSKVLTLCDDFLKNLKTCQTCKTCKTCRTCKLATVFVKLDIKIIINKFCKFTKGTWVTIRTFLKIPSQKISMKKLKFARNLWNL